MTADLWIAHTSTIAAAIHVLTFLLCLSQVLPERPSVTNHVSNAHLGNDSVWPDAQVQHVLRPHIRAPVEPSPHRVELAADALLSLLGCQQALTNLSQIRDRL